MGAVWIALMLRVNPAFVRSDLRETQSGADEHFETVILDRAAPVIIDRGIVKVDIGRVGAERHLAAQILSRGGVDRNLNWP